MIDTILSTHLCFPDKCSIDDNLVLFANSTVEYDRAFVSGGCAKHLIIRSAAAAIASKFVVRFDICPIPIDPATNHPRFESVICVIFPYCLSFRLDAQYLSMRNVSLSPPVIVNPKLNMAPHWQRFDIYDQDAIR